MIRATLAAFLFAALALAACDPGTDAAHSGPPVARDDPEHPRVVALAPHLAELVFAVGAGETLVGTSSYTDFPGYPGDLPVIGDAFALDQERLALLEPDLLLAWGGGTPEHVIGELRQRGYPVAVIATRSLADVPAALSEIGRLTGRNAGGERAAARFREGMRLLAARYEAAEPIRVFYQIDSRPLYTVNGDHYVSELIEICGGENVFAELGELAPLVDLEAVLARDPEVLLASSDSVDPFRVWERWPELAARRYDNRYLLPADEIGRATPRLLKAGETLCALLEEARARRASARR